MGGEPTDSRDGRGSRRSEPVDERQTHTSLTVGVLTLACVPRSCIFCRCPATTREHLWPAWASTVLPAEEKLPVHQLVDIEDDPVVERAWLRRPYREVARVACEGCNHGWMSRLEALAKPVLGQMVQGRALVLGRDEQRTLAAWALKTAAVFERGQGVPWEPTLPAEERRCLKDTGEPSGNVLVWLASYLGEMAGAARVHSTNVRLAPHVGDPSWGSVFIATVSLGPVVFQVFCASNVPGLPDAYALEQRPAITLIWPFREECDWGDREGFNDDGLDDFAGALRTVLSSVAPGSATGETPTTGRSPPHRFVARV